MASVLEGVLAQRLVRRICATCRVSDTPSPADLSALGIAGADGNAPLPRPRLRRVSRHRLPGPDRHLRAVPDHGGGAQPHPPPSPDPRHPPRRDGSRHGHAAARRLGQGVRWASPPSRKCSGSRRKTPSPPCPSLCYRAADRRGQTIDGVMEAPDARSRRRAAAARFVLPDPRLAARRPAKLAVARRLGSHRPARHPRRSPSSSRPRSRPPCRSTARWPSSKSWRRTARVKAIVSDLLVSVRGRRLAERGARQASSPAVLAALHQHDPRRRAGRRARGHLAPALRIPRSARRVQRTPSSPPWPTRPWSSRSGSAPSSFS